MSELTFEPNRAKELADELAKYIHETGFNSLSKNDFYDFVLYLLDKYSNEHFFSVNSNQENAILLKVKPEKIKASRLNIYLKYLKPAEQEKSLSALIPMILDDRIRMKDHTKNSFLQLTIEDPVLRFCLDGKMKAKLGTSPDTSFNSEIVVVHKTDFYKILRIIVQDDERLVKALKKKLESVILEENVKKVFMFLVEGTLEMAGKALPILSTEKIKEGMRICFEKVFHSVTKR